MVAAQLFKTVVAMTYFDEILPRVFKTEGGYVDHPKDPGGATNLGITHITLALWRGVPKVTKAAVRALTKSEAANIYRANYYDRIKGDLLPRGVAYAVLDFAIHSGVSRSIRFLQKTVGAKPDGKIGPVTLRLVGAADPASLILLLMERRLGFLQRLRTWVDFGKGWLSRVNRVQSQSLSDLGYSAGQINASETQAATGKIKPVTVAGILPKSRPRQSAHVTRAIVDEHRHLLPNNYRHAGAIVLFVRGYYSKSFGRAGNDRGVYDDAAFLVTPDKVLSFNANADPSTFRKGVASLKAPQAILYSKGRHGLSRKGPDGKPGYIAFRQASDVTVIRDNIGEDKDSAQNRFWTNMHRGGNGVTSSLGCLTIVQSQWDEYLHEGYRAMDETGQSRLPVILLEYDGNSPPVIAPEPILEAAAPSDPAPTILLPQPMETTMNNEDEGLVLPVQKTKRWYKSKGVIGALGAIIVPVAGIAGYNITPSDVQDIVVQTTTLVSAVSGIVALIGRLVAKEEIG
jgi:lysozyme family protein